MSEYKPIQNSGTIINAMTNNIAQIIFFITISSPFCIVIYAIFSNWSLFYLKIFCFFNQINWSKKLPQISIDKTLPNRIDVTNEIAANATKIISFKTISSPFCVIICLNQLLYFFFWIHNSQPVFVITHFVWIFSYCINYPKEHKHSNTNYPIGCF